VDRPSPISPLRRSSAARPITRRPDPRRRLADGHIVLYNGPTLLRTPDRLARRHAFGACPADRTEGARWPTGGRTRHARR
jgi:hypothetical protein